MKDKISKDLVYHRLAQAKEDIKACEVLYKSKLYKSANTTELIMQYFIL